MASKHFSLQMGEVADILDLLIGFEQQNKVELQFRLALSTEPKHRDIVVTAAAYPPEDALMAQPPLAFASVECLATGLRNLRDVVTHALYQMDFQLALHEFESVNPKRA